MAHHLQNKDWRKGRDSDSICTVWGWSPHLLNPYQRKIRVTLLWILRILPVPNPFLRFETWWSCPTVWTPWNSCWNYNLSWALDCWSRSRPRSKHIYNSPWNSPELTGVTGDILQTSVLEQTVLCEATLQASNTAWWTLENVCFLLL